MYALKRQDLLELDECSWTTKTTLAAKLPKKSGLQRMYVVYDYQLLLFGI
jgi:hypothetical protein